MSASSGRTLKRLPDGSVLEDTLLALRHIDIPQHHNSFPSEIFVEDEVVFGKRALYMSWVALTLIGCCVDAPSRNIRNLRDPGELLISWA